MSPEARTTVTVAILSGDPLVGRALELLLEGAGYEVGLLEELDASKVEICSRASTSCCSTAA